MPQRPTSKDVATLAGVSRTTVSFVMNDRSDVKIPEETRRRVRDAARELGYHPHASARRLAGGRTHVLALVLRQSPEQVAGDAVLAETLRGLAAAARTGGFRVMVEPFALDDPMVTYTALLRAQHADGLVISGPRVDDPSLAELVRDGFPIVLQGALPNIDAPSVDVDNVAGARGAVEHLISLGHRRIACITNAPLVYTAAQERLDGYRLAMEAAGLDAAPELVAEGAFDAPSGHAAMAQLLARTAFDAAFVASDVVALGAIGALREAGRRVPGRRLDRRLRRHPACRLFRPTPHHGPAAGLRARARRRTRTPGTDRGSRDPAQDAAPDRAHRPVLDGSVDEALIDRRTSATGV